MRRKFFTLLALAAFSANLFAAELPATGEPKASDVLIPLLYADQNISLADFVTLTPKSYKQLTGKKLGFKHSVELKVTQQRIKKTISKQGTVNIAELQKVAAAPFQFHLGGFVLGFLLGLIGVLITLFFKDANRKARLTSSLIGLGVVVLILLIFA